MCGQSWKKVGQKGSQVIDQRQKGCRPTDLPMTDQPADMFKAICPLFFKGGITTLIETLALVTVAKINV